MGISIRVVAYSEEDVEEANETVEAIKYSVPHLGGDVPIDVVCEW